ncbi:DNA glycosylase superfamily protein, partial [Prunus dulcis]
MACKAKLMIPEDEKYEGKPYALSHTRTAITTIKAKFNTQQLQRFEGSCFGHLLLIEDLKWNSQIVHGLLMRKADPKTVTQVNGIKFIVGNKLIQFTAQQFCLITGLRFGKLPFIPKATNENCSLKRKYFSSNKPATLSDLHTAFIECTDDEDALKLGMVYFANFVLLGTEKHVLIDMRYLKLAEDLEEFDKYPWGAVSYAMTNASLLRAVCAEYQRVKVPQKRKMPKQRGKRAQTRMRSGRPREYIIRGFGFALQIWAFEVFPALEALHFTVHEDNRHIPRILHWRSNTVARFREVMSQVDVQLLRPTDIEKQQPYWSWGDDDNEEAMVELFGDEAEEKTGTSSEEKDADVEETATLPSSSKAKGSVNDVRSLKHQLRSTKDQLAKLRSSNRGLRNRVRDLEAIVQKNCLKHENECDRNKKAIRDLTLKIAEVEHYLKLEMEELKKNYGGEGHEEVCTAQMNEGGQNDLSPVNEPTSPTTAAPKMDTQVPADGVEPSQACIQNGVKWKQQSVVMEWNAFQPQIKKGLQGKQKSLLMEWNPSQPWKQVDQQPHKVPTSEDVKLPSVEDALLPTPEDGNGYRDWKKTEIEGVGCKVRPPMKCNITLVGDEGDNEATATTPQPRFDPTKPVAMDDVKAIIQLCRAWKTDISAELELEPFEHLDMAMFLIRKRQLSHPQLFGREWTTAEFCLQWETSHEETICCKTVDPPPNYLKNVHHFVNGSWQHGYAQAWTKVRKVYLPYNVRQSHWVAVEVDFVRHTVTVYDSYSDFTSNSMLVRFMEPITHTLAKVLHEMRFYEKSEVEAVKRKGTDMSNFNPFTICRISDVPQQTDGAGIPLHTIDPSKFGYYRLKLAIEAFRGEA